MQPLNGFLTSAECDMKQCNEGESRREAEALKQFSRSAVTADLIEVKAAPSGQVAIGGLVFHILLASAAKPQLHHLLSTYRQRLILAS